MYSFTVVNSSYTASFSRETLHTIIAKYKFSTQQLRPSPSSPEPSGMKGILTCNTFPKYTLITALWLGWLPSNKSWEVIQVVSQQFSEFLDQYDMY